MKSIADYDYLIVGGTTKAATTSLFVYLADHPAICPATYKETRFFLSSDYPLPSKYRYKDNAEAYHVLFPNTDEPQLRMESTPDYLYCPYALERIATFLPHAKLVFSLREPISRLISWYRFAKQIGKLPQDLSFDAYCQMLFDVIASEKIESVGRVDRGETRHEQHLQALEQGCYAHYLAPYFKRFTSAQCHILFYEDLAAQPAEVLSALCRFAGIDANFYKDYAFNVTNRTETMRSSEFHKKYRDFRFRLRQWTHDKPIIHNPLRFVRRAIEPLYLRLNTCPSENVHVSEEMQTRLMNYYKSDVHHLSELIGKTPPWDLFSAL